MLVTMAMARPVTPTSPTLEYRDSIFQRIITAGLNSDNSVTFCNIVNGYFCVLAILLKDDSILKYTILIYLHFYEAGKNIPKEDVIISVIRLHSEKSVSLACTVS